MCTFLNTLPGRSKASEALNPKKNRKILSLSLKPTEESKFYRLRLLGFKSSANDRDFPFIEKYVHEFWGENDKGVRVLKDSVTCPTTRYVNFQGNPYKECPICAYSNSNFIAYKNSNYKDKIAGRNQNNSSRKYRAIIPVYVVQDPNDPKNNGHIKSIMIYDKDLYKNILNVITLKQKEVSVFNGPNAVDFWIDVKKEEIVYREGTPTEYRSSVTKIVNYGFTTKPYDITLITKELIDAFPFDEEYYVSNTKEELVDFYEKYIASMPGVTNAPEENISDLISATKPSTKATKAVAPVQATAPTEDIVPMVKATPPAEPTAEELQSADDDLAALLSQAPQGPVDEDIPVMTPPAPAPKDETTIELTEEQKTELMLKELGIS